MMFRPNPKPLVLGIAILLGVVGCGGGGGTNAAPETPASLTTNVSTTVIDGVLKNAIVCMDYNLNGVCDTGEVQGRTDAAGNVTLAVPNDKVGKYPLVAMVGTDAVDADHGPVTVPFIMTSPASQSSVLSPLTTLVQQTIAATGVSVADAEKQLQSTTGITASLFQDFTKAPIPTDGSVNPGAVARMVVVTTQSQLSNLTNTVGTMAIDGTVITQAALNQAISQRLLQILPALVAVLTDPATAALSPAAQEVAVVNALSSSLLTTTTVATVVAINNQTSSPTNTTATTTTTAVANSTPTAAFSLANLNFFDVNNWFVRTLGASAAQNTPDANNNVRFVDRRSRSNVSAVANWNNFGNPSDQSNLHWNGSAWAACDLNQENISSQRDAAGNNKYNYCDNYETGTTNRAVFDVSGSTLRQVYDQIRAAGYTNLTIANTAALATVTFPTDSKLFYQTSTPITKAYAHSVGTNNEIKQYSAAIQAGGDGRVQAAGIGCNSVEFSISPTIQTSSLEMLVAAFKGTPCVFNGPASFVSGTTTFTSPDTNNESWGSFTLGVGTLGTVSGAPTAFYTGNTRVRVAFTGTGTNPVTYYACKERFNTFSTRNCTSIGTGNYSITTLGDARVMTLSNPPALTTAFTSNRIFVERGGKVYYGYQDKLTAFNAARLNSVAANAFLTQLGLSAVNPEVPMALTAASYQGTWNVTGTAATAGGGLNLIVGGNGVNTCQDGGNSATIPCTLTVSNPATGAFTLVSTSGVISLTGTLNFMTGVASGTFTDTSSTPSSGNFIGARR